MNQYVKGVHVPTVGVVIILIVVAFFALHMFSHRT